MKTKVFRGGGAALGVIVVAKKPEAAADVVVWVCHIAVMFGEGLATMAEHIARQL